MSYFPWDPSLETGVPAIDEQHKGLFVLADKLAGAIATCTLTDEGLCEEDEDTVANAVYGLTDYCIEHFSDEEALMKATGYPSVSLHRSLHEQLTGDTLTITARFFNDEKVIPEALAPFITSWLSDHIRRHDMEFVMFLRAQQAKQAQPPAE
jgi:hemerythrin-like metal-binding protein